MYSNVAVTGNISNPMKFPAASIYTVFFVFRRLILASFWLFRRRGYWRE